MKYLIKTYFSLLFLSISILSIGWSNDEMRFNSAIMDGIDTTKAFKRNQNIGRGMNFGNALEAPKEGEWGLVIRESYVQAIADAGFNSVRLPICWPAHTSKMYPYSIDATFLNRVDEVVKWCLDRKLGVIITIHHFDDLYNYPDDQVNLNIFFAIWKQLTHHYLSIDHERLFFEVLNEPEVNLTADKWNLLMPKIMDTIRVIDNDRTLIIDAPDYAFHESLVKLNIPQSEQNVIVSTRYYLPYQFAQQGAWWSTWTDLNQYLGTTWSGTNSEKEAVLKDISIINDWSKNNKRPVTIGEYGSIMFADNQSRLTWTNYVRTQFDNHHFSWSYFDFGVVFKSYSIAENKWLYGFVEALTGNKTALSDGRTSDSIHISPLKPSVNDSILVTSYIKIPNYCSKTDSVQITKNGSVIKIKAYHLEKIPQNTSFSTCIDSVKLGKYSSGNYTIIFDSEYIDVVNTLHYSIVDTTNIRVDNATGTIDDRMKLIKVYPVPASQILTVENMKPSDHYRITDLNGKLHCAGTVRDGQIQISNLHSGEYIFELLENKKTLLLKKIVINQTN